MITCIIDGQQVFPKLTDNIKVTKQNYYIKDTDSYTYDIAFPMSILENRQVLGNLQRMDVRKTGITFDTCQLLADGLPVITGIGTVTSATNEEVKLQIKSGQAKSRYPSEFYNRNICDIDIVYKDNTVVWWGCETDSDGEQVVPVSISLPGSWDGIGSVSNANAPAFWKEKGYVGRLSLCIFPPIYDAAKDRFLNAWGRHQEYSYATFGNTTTKVCSSGNRLADEWYHILVNPSPCWNLSYIVYQVCKALGYTIQNIGFGNVVSLANNTYIATGFVPDKGKAAQLNNAKYSLPRWSAATLLDEFAKLYNLKYSIDTVGKTITGRPVSSITSASSDSIALTPDDEFSTEYDADGVEYIGTSNIKYDIENDNENRYFFTLTDELRKSFPIEECTDEAELRTKAAAMDQLTRRQTIFHTPTHYFFYHIDDDGNEDLRQCARFAPIIRDEESDTFTTLKLVPAAWSVRGWPYYVQFLTWDKDGGPYVAGSTYGTELLHASHNHPMLTLDEQQEEIDRSATVQSVMEGEADAPSEAETDNGHISLFLFQPSTTEPAHGGWHIDVGAMYVFPTEYEDYTTVPTVGLPFIDGELASVDSPYDAASTNGIGAYSLALTSCPSANYVGQLHQARRGYIGSEAVQLVDTYTKLCVKATYDGVPDPTATYNIGGKLYIAEKIELTIKDGNLQPQKTFYLYEIITQQ